MLNWGWDFGLNLLGSGGGGSLGIFRVCWWMVNWLLLDVNSVWNKIETMSN